MVMRSRGGERIGVHVVLSGRVMGVDGGAGDELRGRRHRAELGLRRYVRQRCAGLGGVERRRPALLRSDRLSQLGVGH